jgi:hypothetical protein
MDSTGKCQLLSTPHSIGLSSIQHWNAENFEVRNSGGYRTRLCEGADLKMGGFDKNNATGEK